MITETPIYQNNSSTNSIQPAQQIEPKEITSIFAQCQIILTDYLNDYLGIDANEEELDSEMKTPSIIEIIDIEANAGEIIVKDENNHQGPPPPKPPVINASITREIAQNPFQEESCCDHLSNAYIATATLTQNTAAIVLCPRVRGRCLIRIAALGATALIISFIYAVATTTLPKCTKVEHYDPNHPNKWHRVPVPCPTESPTGQPTRSPVTVPQENLNGTTDLKWIHI